MPPIEVLQHTARRSEERGFDAIWWPDHLMGWHPQSVWTPEHAPLASVMDNIHNYLDPVAAITAASTVTERVQLGTSVTEPVRNHPAQLARAFLSLHHLTRGRTILGIGAGEGENITPYGIDFDKPATRLEDALRVIRLLWENDDPVDYDGTFYTLRDAVLGMGAYEGTFPPIWVAAHGPRLCRVTGELADGWLPTFLPFDDYAARWGAVTKAAAGRSVTAAMWAYTVVAEDHEASHRILEHPMVKAFQLAQPHEFYEARGAPHPLGKIYGFTDYVPARLSYDEALRAIDGVPFEVAHDATLHGSPADIAGKMRRYIDIGLEHLAMWNITFFADPALTAPSYKLLTETKDELKAISA
jgi:phthiodiolone/phenolphthiodiolone dimycocerosates ketoreductase